MDLTTLSMRLQILFSVGLDVICGHKVAISSDSKDAEVSRVMVRTLKAWRNRWAQCTRQNTMELPLYSLFPLLQR